MHKKRTLSLLAIFVASVFLLSCATRSPQHITKKSGAYILSTEDGRKLRITPYGRNMVRLQKIRTSENFLPDDHYRMVETHTWPAALAVREDDKQWKFSYSSGSSLTKVKIWIDKSDLTATFFQNGKKVLQENAPIHRQDTQISQSFTYDDQENFTGLGHSFYGRESSLNLKGKIAERNYGTKQIEQAPLIVPFFMSSKGYGLFLNSTFSNRFSFGHKEDYSISIDDSGFGGQLDYFFIAGPQLTSVLDNYTQLTGRPRLPMKSMFGLQLSDKGHDHNSPTPSDQAWWQQKIEEHRSAGYPLDHVVNDNRWRAAGGKRCESKLAWDLGRYPKPEDYGKWLDEQGLVLTLDFNRCIGQYSKGWTPEFNIPETGEIDFRESAPDLTNAEFREWFWKTFYNESLDPELDYPGDALWIDEFDEMGAAPKNMILANGRSSAEMRNYWFFLIAQSLVEQGWDKSGIKKRPFVWVRGMTAGAQRYATLWSGDIYPNHEDMTTQVRGMLLAGLSGFPYWGHDAGGFFDWDAEKGPDKALYQQWAMAYGSFAPIWKPHGMGASRWPLDRTSEEQNTAHQFSKLRYELMPYLYTAAHQSAATGIPIARAMILDYQQEPEAWQYDLQYMWGEQMLVAPNTTPTTNKKIWLPKGNWFPFRSNGTILGNREFETNVAPGQIPLYVKAGAIIPTRDYTLSTAFIDKQSLGLDIYNGEDGQYRLIEDDDKTEAYRKENAKMITKISYNDDKSSITIGAAKGNYDGAPAQRRYKINLYGFSGLDCMSDGKSKLVVSKTTAGTYFFEYPSTDIRKSVTLTPCKA